MPRKNAKGITISSEDYQQLLDIGKDMGFAGPDLKVPKVIRALIRIYGERKEKVSHHVGS